MSRIITIAVLLGLLVPATWLLQQATIGDLERSAVQEQHKLSSKWAEQIEDDFERLRNELRERALAVASDEDALRLVSGDFGAEPSDLVTIAAVRRFRKRHEAGPSSSTELFDDHANLVGWSGFSVLPPPSTWPPETANSVWVESDNYRRCLVMWYPVGPNGVVRVAQVAQLSTPGLQSNATKDLATRWTDLTGTSVDVAIDDSTAPESSGSGEIVSVPLSNGAGAVLGRADIRVPTSASLIREGKRRFGDLQAVWLGLIMGWVFIGGWITLSRWWRNSPSSLLRTTMAIAGRLGLLLGLRFGFLAVNFPGRWFRGGQIAAVFDPVYLASTVAGGVARSTGDLLLTGLFSLAVGVAALEVVSRYRAIDRPSVDRSSSLVTAGIISAFVTGVITWHAILTRRAMLDATLDFFAWTGLAPEPLVLVVFCSLILSTLGTILLSASLVAVGIISRGGSTSERGGGWVTIPVAFAPPILAFALGLADLIPVWLFLAYLAVITVTALIVVRRGLVSSRALKLRPIVASILVAATLLYPLVYLGMDAHRRLRLVDVAEQFAERSDDQAIANASALLEQIVSSQALVDLLTQGREPVTREQWRQFARSLPASDVVPGITSARVLLFDARGRPLGGYEETESGAIRVIPAGFGIEPLSPGDTTGAPKVEIERDTRSGESAGYTGITPARDADGRITGWLTAEFERYRITSPFGALFGYSDWRRSLSLAEFRGDVRIRSEGEDFERYTLPTDVLLDLQTQPVVWRNESIYGRAYLTYYARLNEQSLRDDVAVSGTIVAVRARAVIPYDHLYYLLRMALAGLWFGLPLFLVGVVVRWQRGDLPAARTQIGDRVLDAFMLVGTLAVLVMGLVGQQVITRENEGAIRSRLERRLQRVEGALQDAARAGEPLFEVQRRLPLDSLARDLSLDLNVYTGPWLTEYSRMGPDVLPLMGYRLPPDAYDDLFLKRFRQSFVESTGQFGFVYTIGYKALMNAEGNPVSVVAVLTAPEQERIREERARTTAYFFGALLILLLIIMGTATVLASTLAGPISRLRDGLKTVAEGRFQRPIPVDSRDEVGELVETFNLMQSQLAESRRRLAQQERELAWREMARQVAHEIKNPLTPMKLSIQHLQRAFEEGNGAQNPEFDTVFRRITKTVSEQIETLANIANEFSTFARMPKRHLEHLDVNEIVHEAIALVQEESDLKVAFESLLEPAIVEADRDELRRVFINLIKNAVQATTAGGTVRIIIRPDIGLADMADRTVVLVEIVDTGPGIPDDVRDKIFQPNFSTKTSGMGLGLAIAKKSVEDVKGEIGFTTTEGEGSTFWVRLPSLD